MRKLTAILLAVLLTFACALPASADVVYSTTYFEGSATDDLMCAADVVLDTDWFSGSAAAGYQHPLATASIMMATASFRAVQGKLTHKDDRAAAFFAKLGFGEYEACQYGEVTSGNTIGNVFASKMLKDKKGPYALVAIGVSGAGYDDEWLSNFTINDNLNHDGFNSAAQKVYDRFYEYVDQKFEPDTRIKVWISGFSRAAAVSNLVAGLLSSDARVGHDNVFAYLFATPNTTRAPVSYPNIHNICGSLDPVPTIPFESWGYGRHGVTHFITAKEVDIDYDQKTPAANEQFLIISEQDRFFSNQAGNWLVFRLLQLMNDSIPNAEAYREDFQQLLIDVWNAPGGMLGKAMTLMNGMMSKLDSDTLAKKEVRDFFMLIMEALTNSLDELTGETAEANWINLFLSGTEIAHEHFPAVYAAWMMSSEDGKGIFVDDRAYSRLVYEGDYDVTVRRGDEEYALDRFAAFSAGARHYLILPGKYAWDVTLISKENQATEIGLAVGQAGSVDFQFHTMGRTQVKKDEQLTLTVDIHNTDPEETVVYTQDRELPMDLEGSDLSVGTEGTEDRLRLMGLNAFLAIAPRYIALVMILVYFLLMGIAKLFRIGKPNPMLPVSKVPGIILMICAIMSAVFALNHTVLFVMSFGGTSSEVFRNQLAYTVAKMVNRGLLGYEAINMLLYGMLAWLCYRGRTFKRSRTRCRRVNELLLIISLLELAVLRMNPFPVEMAMMVVRLAMIVLAFVGLIAGRMSVKKQKPEPKTE